MGLNDACTTLKVQAFYFANHSDRAWIKRLQLIGSTTTKQGLKVKCVLDEKEYPTGIKVSEDDYNKVDIERIDPMPDWNYIIRGFLDK